MQKPRRGGRSKCKTAMQAREACDPSAQIRGWSEFAKMLGFYAPETKRLVLGAESAARRAELEAIGDEELLALAEAAR